MASVSVRDGWIERNAQIEIPLVCSGCGAVHRVECAKLAAPTVLCPTCGLERQTAALVATLPRTLRPRPTPRRLVALRP